jgi:hypothetical protein
MKPGSLEELVDVVPYHKAAHRGTGPQSLRESANEALVKVFRLHKYDLVAVAVRRKIASSLDEMSILENNIA